MARKTDPKDLKPGFFHRLRTNFLTGLIVVAPVLLTVYIVWGTIRFIDARVVPWVPAIYNPATYFGADIPGFGLIVFILLTAIMGALTKGLFGRQIVRYGERMVDRMPVVRSIYNSLKQILETVLSQSSTSFQHVVMVEYPRKGTWGIGFLATTETGEISERLGGRPMASVFIPTTPNPTSGFLIFVPVDDIIILDMTLEEGAKLIISGGLIVPPRDGSTVPVATSEHGQ
jgi:uncharacterized membrane protein